MNRFSRTVRNAALVLSLGLCATESAGEPLSPPLELHDAVRLALDANLDLAARRRELAAAREQVGVARSGLLPQVDLDAQASYLDSERSNDGRGNSTRENVTVGAKLSQILYDDETWAGFQIQEKIYIGQKAQFEAALLGVVSQAASAYLSLDRSRAQLAVQVQNRELTAENLETSRARIAAGYSSEREVLRWESQLAANDRSVVGARTTVLANRFALNRVLNRGAETPVNPVRVTVEEYGFVYARPEIADAVVAEQGDRRLRDQMSRVALARSPELVAIKAAIQAAEREQVASNRAFWVPTLSFGAGINHLESYGDDSPDFDKTEWGLGFGLDFALFQGGSKFSVLAQSRETLESLRLQRRAIAQQIDQNVRSAFAQASGSYAGVGFARIQEAKARRNFELVDRSYALGVASILALLDAQSLLLQAEIAVVNAHYAFLGDLVAAERAAAFFPFLEADATVETLVDDVSRAVAAP